VRRTRARAAIPADVTARLSALERRVEEALGDTGLRERPEHETIRVLVDAAFAAIASVRRLNVRDAVATAEETLARLAAVDAAAVGNAVLRAARRYWWRVEATGLERVPAQGRLLLAVNRSGGLVPWEALVVSGVLAEFVRSDLRLLVDDWSVPRSMVAAALGRAGLERAGIATTRRLLAGDQAVLLFPEGRQALAKPYRNRYRLAGFGPGTFARVAIETGAPVVPVAVIGAEESQPVLARLDGVGRLLGLPTVPLTATFPWLGLAGLVPLPSKWTIHFGEPLDVAASHAPRKAARTDVVGRVRDQVRERLQALVTEGRRRRPSIFRA